MFCACDVCNEVLFVASDLVDCCHFVGLVIRVAVGVANCYGLDGPGFEPPLGATFFVPV